MSWEAFFHRTIVVDERLSATQADLDALRMAYCCDVIGDGA